MITQEQIKKLCGDDALKNDVFAVLTRDYKSKKLDYVLLKGTVVNISVYKTCNGDLCIGGLFVDFDFPYDAAELLDDNSRTD